jgi:proteasome lid subunit RPN8/RPN11
MRLMASSTRWEVVGYIIGKSMGNNEFHAEALIMARNVSMSEVEFLADPRDILVAHVVAENMVRDVVGVFHSHPSCAPAPSRRDLEGMKMWPLIWVIASPEGLGAYLPLKDGRVKRCLITC